MKKSSNYFFALLINLFTILTAGAQTDWSFNTAQTSADNKKEFEVLISPTLIAGTLTNPTYCNESNGSITFTTTNIPDDYYTLNFKKNNVAQSPITIWINSDAFILGNLTAGSYSDFSIEVGAETATLTTAQVLNRHVAMIN